MKQISLSLPENLFKLSKEHSYEFGYRSLQEFIVDLIRKKVIADKAERYKAIEIGMKQGKKVKRMGQKEAEKYLAQI